MNDNPFDESNVPEHLKLKNPEFERLIDNIGSMYAKAKSLQIENDALKEQNAALIKQNLMMKKTMEDLKII